MSAFPTKALRAAGLISLLPMCINSCFCNEIQRRKKGKRTDVESDWAWMSYGACLLINICKIACSIFIMSAGSINNIFSDMKRERVSSMK